MKNVTMTTATDRRPLPYTLADLRTHWLPPEPDDTTVSAARTAQAAIWAALTAASAELDHLEADERAAVAALVEVALAGADIDGQADELGRDSQVPAARHHLELLRSAGSTATSRLNTAMLTDPGYLAWQAERRQLEDEWHRCMSAEDRTSELLAFIERHRPS